MMETEDFNAPLEIYKRSLEFRQRRFIPEPEVGFARNRVTGHRYRLIGWSKNTGGREMIQDDVLMVLEGYQGRIYEIDPKSDCWEVLI